uniref:NotI domain-containing protein n=1 Tax=Globodera pallida TaxID=36090 RepID=A0A183C3N6_GLOPA
MKLETESRGGRRLKAAKVLSAARVGLNDEAFFMVGSDEALARMMRREKAKVFSKVNLRNPLLIELPDQLLIYEGQSMLLYDSRVHRPGQSDTRCFVSRLYSTRGSYVARIFIGLTAHELEEGVDIAFAPRIDDSHHSSILSDHDYIRRVQQQQANVVPRWEHPIIRSPQFKIAFWNVNYRALASIEKTNNAMEASHQQMASDIDKQCDIARAARSFNHVRRKQYVIRENRLMTTLARAEYVTNEDLLNLLTLIGLQLQGYVAGIRVRNLENVREEESTADDFELSEENTGNDSNV